MSVHLHLVIGGVGLLWNNTDIFYFDKSTYPTSKLCGRIVSLETKVLVLHIPVFGVFYKFILQDEAY